MPNERRLEPVVISFDAGIKADAPGESADFADMVNLMPPLDGSAGVVPRLPLILESIEPAQVGQASPLVSIVQLPDTDLDGAAMSYPPMVAIRSKQGHPVALFPMYDAAESFPEDWQNTGREYYIP